MSALTNAYFQNSPDMLCIADAGGLLLETNRAWEQVMGWNAKQLSEPLFEQFHVAAKSPAREAFRKVRGSSLHEYFEGYVRHGDGSFRYLFWNVSYDNQTKTFQLSAREKTEFQTNIEALGNSKQHLQTVFSSMREGVVTQDGNHKVIQFNEASLEILGLSADQLLGRTSYDESWKLVDEDGSEIDIEKTASVLALNTGIPQTDFKMGIRRPNGDLRWVSINAIPLFKGGEDKPYQVVITFHDITEEKNAMIALAVKENELSRVIDNIPSLISYWDRDLRNVFSNRAYATSKQLTPETLKGKHFRDIMLPSVYEVALGNAQRVLAGEIRNFEVEMPFARDDYRPVIASYVPDIIDGKVAGFISIATDMSAIKKLEKERREFESKFIAASKMSALGEMAAGVAHEINNPLAIIDGKSMLLQERIRRGMFDPQKFESDLKSISNTVERIAKTVRGLLAFSRNAEAEGMKKSNLRNVVESTLDLCSEKMRARGVELRFDVDSDVEAECRSNQISQIVMNLLNNSFDAIDGLVIQWIHVSVKSNEKFVQIRVTDSGRPIATATIEKMMNPFFTTKDIGKGTGLGLSISKGLAESHGGSLNYDKSSTNTSFVLEIPRLQNTVTTSRKVG